MASTKEKGGYDVIFVDNEPKDVTCSICLFVLREPMQAEECGHRFCKECLEDLKDKNGNGCITCPQDRIVNKVFRDRGKEREILDYIIKCTNVVNGCKWIGELRDLEKHKELCEYQLVSCENEGCREEIQRRYLLQHMNADCSLRNVDCEYCKTTVKFCHLEVHNKLCENKPLECNTCKSKVPKDLMSQHLEKECPMIVCDYLDIGCQEMVKRECMTFHKENSTEHHLDCVISKLREQEKLLQIQLQMKENQLQQQRTELNRQSATIQRQKKQLEEQQSTINGQQVQIIEIFGKLALQEQVNEKQERVFNDVKELKEQVSHNSERLHWSQSIEVFQNEQIWVIDNFNRKFEGVKRGNNIYSQRFFTQKAYKCKADLFLNGDSDGRGTHVSLYISLEEGPFDDTLIWPIDATISFCVLKNGLEKNKFPFSTTHSNGIKQNFKRPRPSSIAYGYQYFIPHNSIYNFIVNNTLTLKISVQFP